MRIAEFEPPVMIRFPSGVYVRTVVPGVSRQEVGWLVGRHLASAAIAAPTYGQGALEGEQHPSSL